HGNAAGQVPNRAVIERHPLDGTKGLTRREGFVGDLDGAGVGVVQLDIQAGVVVPHPDIRRVNAGEMDGVSTFGDVFNDGVVIPTRRETGREDVGVVSGTAVQIICAVAADEKVVPGIAVNIIVASQAADRVD